MTPKKRDDFAKMVKTSHPIFPSLIVILTNPAKPEEALQAVKDVQITFVLNDSEFQNDLEADLYRWVSLDTDEKASFSVYESNHPLWIKLHRSASLLWMPGV